MCLICPSHLCPPDSSVRFSFQTAPKATLTSSPVSSSWPSGWASLAIVPGSSIEKILPKSYPPIETLSREWVSSCIIQQEIFSKSTCLVHFLPCCFQSFLLLLIQFRDQLSYLGLIFFNNRFLLHQITVLHCEYKQNSVPWQCTCSAQAVYIRQSNICTATISLFTDTT